jgi:hypothetical protein
MSRTAKSPAEQRRRQHTVGYRLRQPQHPPLRVRRSPRGAALRPRRRTGRQRQVRRACFKGNPRNVFTPERPSHRLPLHAQTRIMAQSDRNLVFHPGAKAHPPRQLRQQGHVEDQDRAVHRLLQRHHGQALPLDLRWKTSRRLAQPRTPKMSPSIPLGCTSRFISSKYCLRNVRRSGSVAAFHAWFVFDLAPSDRLHEGLALLRSRH